MWCNQADEEGRGFDGQDPGAGGDYDDDDDDAGGVDFGLSVVDDVSQSQFATCHATDDLTDEVALLAGDNLLAVPRKVGRLSQICLVYEVIFDAWSCQCETFAGSSYQAL